MLSWWLRSTRDATTTATATTTAAAIHNTPPTSAPPAFTTFATFTVMLMFVRNATCILCRWIDCEVSAFEKLLQITELSGSGEQESGVPISQMRKNAKNQS